MAMATTTLKDDVVVAASVRRLEEHGLGLADLFLLSERDIESFAPTILNPVEVVKLKLALKREKGVKEAEKAVEKLYQRFLRFVGRVDVTFGDDVVQVGNAVLVWENGHAVTAYHICTQASPKKKKDAGKAFAEVVPEIKEAKVNKVLTEVNKGTKTAAVNQGKKKIKVAKGRGKKESKIKGIKVIFPNMSEGVMEYDAELVHFSEKDDIALLRACAPRPPRFGTIETLHIWAPYHPDEGDSIVLLSFPAGRGEEARISHKPSEDKDFPWSDVGHVTCFNSSLGQGFGNYCSFGGASGGLLVHYDPDKGEYKNALHLGTYHESTELAVWNKSQLGNLNESISQKACNGYFSTNVGGFLMGYFQPQVGSTRSFPQHLHPQVVVRKKIKADILEELDLFGPWPGLDDVADSN